MRNPMVRRSLKVGMIVAPLILIVCVALGVIHLFQRADIPVPTPQIIVVTATPLSATPTLVPPTATQVPPTETPLPPTVTPVTLAASVTPSATPQLSTCGGIGRSKLIGQNEAKVTQEDQDPLLVWEQAGDHTQHWKYTFPAGSIVKLLDGPWCGDGRIWWKVQQGDNQGWAVEFKAPSYQILLPVDPTVTVASTPQQVCSGLPTRLSVGDKGQVIASLAGHGRLRKAPGMDEGLIDEFAIGTPFDVIAGPACANGGTWWKVQLANKQVGWMMEGYPQPSKPDDYYIGPIDANATAAPTTVATAVATTFYKPDQSLGPTLPKFSQAQQDGGKFGGVDLNVWCGAQGFDSRKTWGANQDWGCAGQPALTKSDWETKVCPSVYGSNYTALWNSATNKWQCVQKQ